MKKPLWVIAVLGAIVAITLTLGPSIVEQRTNRVRGIVPSIPKNARILHQKLLIVDLHADTLLWERSLLKHNTRGHADVPRLIEGNNALQAFTVVNKAPRNLNMVRNEASSDILAPLAMLQRWPVATWFSPKQRALYQAKKFQFASAASAGKLTWIRRASDLASYLERRRHEPGLAAGFLGIEGGDALEGELANLQPLFNAGFRMVSPTHFTDNEFAGSATGAQKGGLTPLGRKLIQEMEARHMVVDLAHASPQTLDDVLDIATKPVLVSHTGVKATCKSNRNLTDEQIQRIARNEGVIGIAYFQAAVCGTDAKAIVQAIRHVVLIGGIDHVALGSDFDGNTAMPFDATGVAAITAELLKSGFSEAEIAKIMGGNALRFLQQNLP